MKTVWTDVSLDWVEYQEERVKALYEENLRLKLELEFLKSGKKNQQNEYPLPGVLVC